MRLPHHTLRAAEVQTLFAAWLAPVLGPWPPVRRCTRDTVLAVVAYAAAHVTSISDACARLRDAPDGDTVLGALIRQLPTVADLDHRLRAAFADHLPRAVRRGRWTVAIDTTLIPYHGQPFRDLSEVYRGQPKGGTTHFHAYATAYLVRTGRRFTLALLPVTKGLPAHAVVRELRRRVVAAGVKPRRLLPDRGFHTAGVVRYLQFARQPFIMPQAIHGKAPKTGPVTGLRAIRAYHRTGGTTYTWKPNGPGQRWVSVDLAVVRRRRRNRHGHRAFLYACWGIAMLPRSVYRVYRTRFGIETSYRQMHQARIRTTSRRPVLRLFFVAVALLLRNLWARVHWTALAVRRRGGRRVHLDRLRFRTLVDWLEHLAEAAFRYLDETIAETPPDEDFGPKARRTS